MEEVFKITEDMRSTRETEINQRVKKVNRYIKESVEEGLTYAHFPIYPSDTYYNEIKRMYECQGYTIKPTGYSGGVWQRTERICW